MNVIWFMNRCRRHQANIALMVVDLCPESDRRWASHHLQHCPRCREYFRDFTQIGDAMARLRKEGARTVPGAGLRSKWMDQVLSDPPAPAAEGFRRRPGRAGGAWFRRPGLAWGLVMAACVLAAFLPGYEHSRPAPGDPLADAKMVRETLGMFPHQIRAIVEDGHGMNLILSDQGNIPASAPLYVHICDGKQCSSFLTFSGQEITVDGQKLTVLEDAQGGVILAGNDFVWSNANGPRTEKHWQIEAKNLGPAIM